MRIAVSSAGNTLDSLVDPRFGRRAYFIIADVEGSEIKNVKAIKNPAISSRGGAGIQAAQLIASNKVEVLITGNIGPNAVEILSSRGIKIAAIMPGISVREAIEKYLKGELGEVQGPTTGFGGFGAGRGRMGFGRRFQ